MHFYLCWQSYDDLSTYKSIILLQSLAASFAWQFDRMKFIAFALHVLNLMITFPLSNNYLKYTSLEEIKNLIKYMWKL